MAAREVCELVFYIDDASYLAGFLACWLNGRVFSDASMSFSPNTYVMFVEMAWDKRYSLVVPYLALTYKVLKEIQYKSGGFENLWA